MYQMDTAVLESFSGGSTPIDIFAPLDSWSSDVVKPAKIGDRAAKGRGHLDTKEFYKISVHFPAPDNRGDKHAHNTNLRALSQIIERPGANSQSKQKTVANPLDL
jgi:hypothetical protein